MSTGAAEQRVPLIASLLSAHRGASAERDVEVDSGKREDVVARHVAVDVMA